ncbi:hypothetical protein [Streptomyces kebangsaanensis]|uniref:hypothetical protein n=1 Tax=Streptomyces kebangsaanensis TaxID=864058 RepID=UPI0009402CEE|nr:hypothetical protein [Streptomyces kebangsaanensis]
MDTRVLHLNSEFQKAGTRVTLLLPKQRVRRVVLALPVEKNEGRKYGHSLDEVRRLPAPLRHGTLFAAPTFSESPWLVNHASRADCRQEDHLVRLVVPAVVSFLGGVHPPLHLLGFSKGGFAALNLLARHPRLFTIASVWDASLLSDRPPHPQLVDVAGSAARLGEYDVRQNLRRYAPVLRGSCRIALGGVGTLEGDWTAGRQLLEEVGILHRAYRDAPAEHRWSVAWLAPAMRHLLELEARLPAGPRDPAGRGR